MSTATAWRLPGPGDPRPVTGRPALRLVEGGNSITGGGQADTPHVPGCRRSDVAARHRRRASNRVRRQRMLVGAALATIVGLLAVPLGVGSAPASSLAAVHLASNTNLPLQVGAGQGVYYVVRPGDTLATISRRLDPADPGATAARLARHLGSSTVVAGEHIPVG